MNVISPKKEEQQQQEQEQQDEEEKEQETEDGCDQSPLAEEDDGCDSPLAEKEDGCESPLAEEYEEDNGCESQNRQCTTPSPKHLTPQSIVTTQPQQPRHYRPATKQEERRRSTSKLQQILATVGAHPCDLA
jgi:hypothetical protein